jgi:hypothetical protein
LPINLNFFLESRKLKFKEIIYKREREREKKILKLNLYKDIKKKKTVVEKIKTLYKFVLYIQAL